MIGAGVFSAWGPATDAAGTGVLIGLVVAALVAFCNATSSAQLAAVHPESGGTYVYARRQLGPVWGHLAGWGFVIGKTASCAAMALTAGAYLWPDHATARRHRRGRSRGDRQHRRVQPHRPVTKFCSRWRWSRSRRWSRRLVEPDDFDARDSPRRHVAGRRPARGRFPVLRLRRLRPDRHPRRGGPRPGHHHSQGDPSRAGRRAGDLRRRRRHVLAPFPSGRSRRATHRCASSSARRPRLARAVVRVGAGIAALGVLFNLDPGRLPHRAGDGSPPRAAALVRHDRRAPLASAPRRALVTAVVIALTATLDLRGAIGFSGVTILTYYAITNAACSHTPLGGTPLAAVDQHLGPRRLRRPRCHVAIAAIITGAGVLVAGIAIRTIASSARWPRLPRSAEPRIRRQGAGRWGQGCGTVMPVRCSSDRWAAAASTRSASTSTVAGSPSRNDARPPTTTSRTVRPSRPRRVAAPGHRADPVERAGVVDHDVGELARLE